MSYRLVHHKSNTCMNTSTVEIEKLEYWYNSNLSSYLEGGMTGINRCSYRSRRSNCIQETVFIPTADRHDASGSGTTILVIVLTAVLLKDVGSVKVGEKEGRGGRGERRGREG